MNATQMLVTIPYCQKDSHLARRLINWIGKLSPKLGPHCCLLAADSAVPHQLKVELQDLAKAIFYNVETAIIPVSVEDAGWPKAANAMFRIASLHVQECYRLPWLWMEPDCTPLVPSWLDELSLHYTRCPKLIMGTKIRADQPPLPPIHVAGCAVYPPTIATALKPFTEGPMAFDIANAAYAVPRTHDTPLIHHHYGTMELPPTFKSAKVPGDPINTCTLDFIHKGAVVFHRCKDGTLIDVLEKQQHSSPEPVAETSAAPPPTQGKRSPGRPRKPEPAPA